VILAGGAGSEDSATGLVYLIYQHAFNFNDLNGAAAIGVMMLIVLGVFSGLYAWLSRDRD
jgi:multiple sugar transport system permease protein